MSETSKRVLAMPAVVLCDKCQLHGANNDVVVCREPGNCHDLADHAHNAVTLAREVETLEAANAKLNEQRLTALGLGDLEREALEVLRPQLAEAERKLAALRSALMLHVTVYGGADHHKDDCEDFDTCLQCQADAAAVTILDRKAE